jgi:hypothetical protein
MLAIAELLAGGRFKIARFLYACRKRIVKDELFYKCILELF